LEKYFHTKVIIVLYFVIALLSQSAIANENDINNADNQETVSESVSPILIIDDITCTGNETTQCSFITKKYYQKIGDVLDSDEIIDAKLRLGTLIQFKHVNVFLKKGHQRGHVVVVFDIKEASNLQYEIVYQHKYFKTNDKFYTCDDDTTSKYNEGSIDRCNRNKYKTAEVRNTLYGNIKNFNFLGSGKELTLEVYQSKTDNQANHFTQAVADPEDFDYWSSRNIKHLNYINIQYHDPHLFNSPYYYFNAYIDTSKLVHKSHTKDLNGVHIEPKPTIKEVYTWFSLGRRFGRHSYFSVNMTGSSKEKINQSYQINYGFNSENDVLFPTSGTKFSLSNSFLKDANQLSYSYIKNFTLTDHSAISLGSKGGYLKYTDGKHTYVGVNAKYSNIRAINQRQGEYAGWFIGVEALKRKTIFDDTPHERKSNTKINAGYVHQTENIVYRLSFSVSLNETE